ncbi:hypothetical protein [Streptomyces durhamensis]|uniref:hypothetical protein n=1 Tax=Streptomyces durhamensis TaxID=68194 RepID=UPI0006900D11|nr:hypothetical protein [Streptomyces durhamensis]
MADEQDKWLNRETAERLLRGESLEAVDASARDQAERLSRALGALSSEAAPATGELPGEQAALAAFRKAREAAETERTAAAPFAGGTGRSVPGADAGLVRIGAPGRTGTPARRPRWGRPVRLALAAAMAVGTVGGVAMAAGSGMLHTPFAPEKPGPSASASVSPDETSAVPFAPVPPEGTSGTTVDPGAPSGGPRGRSGDAPGEAAGPDDRAGGSDAPGTGEPSGSPRGRWKDAAAACRDIRDGRELEAGRRRALENLAGGSARVSRYCKVVLSAADLAGGATSGGRSGGSGTAKGTGGGGKSQGKDEDNGKDKGKGDDDGPGRGRHGRPGKGGGHHGQSRGHGRGPVRHGAAAAPIPSALTPTHPI